MQRSFVQGSSAENVHLACRSVPRSVSYGRCLASPVPQSKRSRCDLAGGRSTLSSGQSSGLLPSFRLEASLLSTSLSDKELGNQPEDGPFCCSDGTSAHAV